MLDAAKKAVKVEGFNSVMHVANTYIPEVDSILCSAQALYQSWDHHHLETHCSKKRHTQALGHEHKNHVQSLKISKQTYLMAAFSSLEKHFQQLTADLINSSRESENDMFDQRNQSFQTIILSASVMFSSLATVIIQGFLPDHADTFLYIAYAFTCSFSFFFLFLSIVLCIEVTLRTSKFMYKRAHQHTLQLQDSINKARAMIDDIRKGTGGEDIKITDLVDEKLNEQWEAHEEKVHKLLQEREKINEDAHNCGTSFETFYDDHCKFWGHLAIFAFYAGTAFLLLAIMVYMWSEFDITYESLSGAVVAVVLIGISLVVGSSLAVSMRITDRLQKQNAEETEDSEYCQIPNCNTGYHSGTSTNRMDHEEGGGAIHGMGIDSRSEMSGSEVPSRIHTPTRQRSHSRAPSVASTSVVSAHTMDVEIASTVDHNHPRHIYRGRTRRAGSIDTIKQSEDNEQYHPRQRSILSISGSTPRNTLWNRSMNQLLNGHREEVKEGHVTEAQLRRQDGNRTQSLSPQRSRTSRLNAIRSLELDSQTGSTATISPTSSIQGRRR